MIDIWRDTSGHYRFHCPTPDCPATPRDWFYHGPVMADRLEQRTPETAVR
jgi:hypothetical protein